MRLALPIVVAVVGNNRVKNRLTVRRILPIFVFLIARITTFRTTHVRIRAANGAIGSTAVFLALCLVSSDQLRAELVTASRLLTIKVGYTVAVTTNNNVDVDIQLENP